MDFIFRKKIISKIKHSFFGPSANVFGNESTLNTRFYASTLDASKHLTLSVSLRMEKFINLFSIIYKTLIWSKARVIYYVNNWVYTTNHKRIAVNYFWFVIFSGICGMVLATIIRLEMAYPGIGILAGDSLQYLSIVTAHAVIMVFFMIMPLLFGAFGNFLLPTQLGVHDVAFPRLNSAAFWFLPAGLLMLVQLVCLDRRYQRMNCFNIREIQALLKARFFSDLVNSNDHTIFLNKTVIGLRYKTHMLDMINPNMLLFYRYGIQSTSAAKYYNFITEDASERAPYSFLNQHSLVYQVLTSTFCFRKGLRDVQRNILPNYDHNTLYKTDLTIIESTAWMKVYWQVMVYYLTSAGSCGKNFRGEDTCWGLFDHFIASIASEFKRQWYELMNTLDFNEPFWVTAIWYDGTHGKHIDDLQMGLFHNNMGLHKDRLDMYVQPIHPEIITSEGLFVLYFTGIHHLLSKSLFVFFRKLFITYYLFFIRWGNKALNLYYYIMLSGYANLKYFNPYYCVSFLHPISSSFSEALKVLNSWPSTMLSNAKLFLTDPLLLLTPRASSFSALSVELRELNLASLDWRVDNSLISTSETTFYVDHTTKLNARPWSNTDMGAQIVTSGEEISSNYRYQRFTNPVFLYHYKLGNYLPQTTTMMFPHLFTSMAEVTSGIRKSAWFLSNDFLDLFTANFNQYTSYFAGTGKTFVPSITEAVTLSHTFAFYNFFNGLVNSNDFMDQRWISIKSMNQKFYKLFTTSSMQQRVYGNWRQLKFTREAWRCKLLASRHQKTLFHRYINEENVFWAVERNAKDLLPGWAMITPFSARTRFTAMGKVALGLMGVFLVLNSSIVSSANFLVTYRYLSTLNNRKMRDARAFFAEGVMVASWMMIAANPMLAIGILMLLSDRHWQTSFFDYSGGGDTVLFQHMFWFFGHPEVYVVMIPVFGFTNTILSFYLRKRVSARASLMYSMYTIAFLGFFVWGHHMYMVGLAHTTRMLFSTLTVMISVPAATKLMHWCVTIVNSSFVVELPLIFTFLFIFFFVSGGISGMAVAHTGMDILFHDTFYVVGHFHVMFAGSAMFGSFGAFYFYFPSIFGVKFSRIWGYLNCTYYLIGQLMTVIPMIWLGYSGMPRRVLDYPAALGGWHAIISAGHMLSVAGMMAFFIMIFDSLRQAKAVTRNTFGITRFNTRLNFYLYETNRTHFLKKKGWYLSRFDRPNSLKLNKLNFNNNEYLETTLYSYSFLKN